MIDARSETSPADGGATARTVWVLEIGGSHATAAIVRLSGAEGSVVDSETEALDPSLAAPAVLDAFAAPAGRLRARVSERGCRPPDRWVVAVPGPFDYENGVGIFGEVGKFDALRGVSVRSGLADRLGVEEERVVFINDAAAYAFGEWAFGADARARRHVCITLGTGVGSAFLADGAVVADGPEVPPNGWAYLLEFDGRPLEDTVSTRAITRRFAELTGRSSSVRDIAASARAGDEVAVEVLDHAMFALGAALSPWLASFHADRLTIGGSMVRSWPLLVDALMEGLAHGGAPRGLEVLPSVLLDDAPVLGAASWFANRTTLPHTPTWSDQR